MPEREMEGKFVMKRLVVFLRDERLLFSVLKAGMVSADVMSCLAKYGTLRATVK
jgi:hypothetical protein